jgi:hypothetical protein
LLACFVFLFGILIAKLVAAIVIAFLNKIRLNQALKRIGLEEALLKIDTRLNAPKFFGELVKWFFILVFLMVSSDILGLSQFSQFLGKVLEYFPNIFIACLIFLVAVFLTDLSKKVFVGTLEKERLTYSRFLGREISWVIWILAILAILYQLKIVPALILVIFIGVVATISLAVGISFGLGGKDLAAKILKELEEKFK